MALFIVFFSSDSGLHITSKDVMQQDTSGSEVTNLVQEEEESTKSLAEPSADTIKMVRFSI